MNILITGANGFLGGHLAKACLDLGYNTYAGHRRNADTAYLESIGCNLITLPYKKTKDLSKVLLDLKKQQGEFDLIIHNAAIVRSIKPKVFYDVNCGLTKNLIYAIKESQILKEDGKLALTSSLAAMGPVGFGGPISDYGRSKLKAESLIKASGIPYMFFRPTAIYGPRDTSFIALFKAIKIGLYPMINPKNQKITMIHGADVARNIIQISQKHTNEIVPLDDGNVYTHKDIKSITCKLMNKKAMMLQLPLPFVRLIFHMITFAAKVFKVTPPLTAEKHYEISQNWDHDFSSERDKIPLEIRYDLESGLKDTIRYNQLNKLI